MAYAWNFAAIWQYQNAFAMGITTTIALSIAVIALATVLGVALGVARSLPSNNSLRTVAGAVVELLRAVPKIVLLVWLFYAFPIISGFQLPAFETALVGLSIVSAAFVAEIVRGGIEGIPRGQIESAKSLGMNDFQILSSIVLPQAIMKSMPALVGEYTTTVKDSTLAVIIGVTELLHVTSDAAILSYRPLELYTFLGFLFLVIILPMSLLSKKLEFKALTKKPAL